MDALDTHDEEGLWGTPGQVRSTRSSPVRTHAPRHARAKGR
jgi:hypothetical protein